MNHCAKRTLAILLCFALLVAFFPFTTTIAANTDNLNKLPDSYVAGNGKFTLNASARIFVVSDAELVGSLRDTATLIAETLSKAGYPSTAQLPIVWGPEAYVRQGDLVLKLTNGIQADGYRIEIARDHLTINASDTDGLLYGTYTLIRYFRINGTNTLSCATIKDEPDTKERTLMLDCARKYWSVEWIENLIREMSWMGYNTLELHITEDQGMHMNIWSEGADCNGNDFSWLCGYKATTWASAAPDPNGGNNYSAAQIREIVELAQKYHIEVIPSVDVPCHCDYLIYKYRNYVASHGRFQFNYGGKTYTSPAADQFYIPDSDWGNQDWTTVNINNTEAKYLTLAIIEAYADFFGELGCTKMNIGCDEVVGTLSYDAFVRYVNEACAMLKNRGYSVRAFNDYLYGSSSVALDKDLEICLWTPSSNASVSDYLRDGRKVYNCLGNYCYYVLRQSPEGQDARDPNNYWWSFHHSTEDRIYNEWNPTRTWLYNASGSATTSISGGYFLIWGDWAGWSTEDQVWYGIDSDGKYNLIDRMWSNSVKMWNWDINNSLSYSDFATLREAFGDFPGFDGKRANSIATDDIVAGGEYVFRSAANRSYSMTVENVSTADNANICVRPYQGTDADHFCIVASSESGYYNIRSSLSGKNLDITNDATANLTNVRQMTASDAACQKWSFVKNSDGTYTFFGKTSGKALDVYGAVPGNKVNVEIYESNGTVAQKWVLERVVDTVISEAPNPTALAALLEKSFTESVFTEESWQAYESAREAAQAVYDDVFSTQEELDQAAARLDDAIAAMAYKTTHVYYKTMVGENEAIVREMAIDGGYYSFSLSTPMGYKFLHAERPASFEPYTYGSASGTVKGYATVGHDVVIWLENTPDLSILEALLAEDWSGYGNYAQYAQARAEVQEFYDSVKDDPANLTHQIVIDEYEAMLRSARELLTMPSEATEIISVDTPTRVAKGKKAVIKLTTSSDVTAVSVEGVTLQNLTCSPFVDENGVDLKYWTFRFDVSEKGAHTYCLTVDGDAVIAQSFSISCA